jgi:phage shock protein C
MRCQAVRYIIGMDSKKEVNSMKRLYRSRRDRILAGGCAGIADYFGSDPTIVRILAVIMLVLFNVASVIAYLIMIVVVPLEPIDAAPGNAIKS